MPHDFLAPPTFAAKTRCTSALLLLLELVSAGALFALYALAPLHRDTLLLNGLVGIVSILCGVMGVCRSTPAVVTSYMVAIGSSFGFSLLGGLCILFTSSVELEVAAFLNKSLVPSDVEDREELLSDTKKILGIAAAVLIVNAIAHLSFSSYLRRLVGARRAAVAFLQVFSVIMFPISLFLILGGNYIVDTGTLASAPYAGLAIFTSGVLLLLVALLAFIGGNFEYRRLLSVCYLISALIGACLVVLAITCFAGRSFVEGNIIDNWESIRILLPPTAQVAYDRDRFAAVMRSNLNTVAFVGLISGLFVLSEASMSLTLLRHASSWKRQVARAKQSMKDLRQTAVNLSPIGPTASVPRPDSPLSSLQQWLRLFESSTRRQRIAMRIVIVFIVLAVVFILAVMCANVILVAKCSSIGSRIASANFPLFNSSTDQEADTIRLTNSFSRGEMVVGSVNSTNGSVDMEVFSAESGAVAPTGMYDMGTENNTISITIWPKETTQFLWLDTSCQRSMMQVAVPSTPLRTLVVNSNTTVVVKASDSDPGDNMVLHSTSGDISVDGMVIDASDMVAGSPARVSSALGLVSLTNVVLSQCDLHVETGASSLELSDVHSSVNEGRSQIQAKSSSASISVDDIQANWITLKSETGDIYGSELLVEGNGAFLGRLEVTSVSGDVTLEEITASGTIHVESSSGKISVQLNTQTFAGMYFMRSEYGTMSIRQSNYSSDTIFDSEDSTDRRERHGSINCNPAINNCLAFGSVYLRSNLGDVEIVLGCDSYSCS
ncbi:hypothetical protein PRNP1_007840 [Phytophthora ramorum]